VRKTPINDFGLINVVQRFAEFKAETTELSIARHRAFQLAETFRHADVNKRDFYWSLFGACSAIGSDAAYVAWWFSPDKDNKTELFQEMFA
jgi:hypothetical protein